KDDVERNRPGSLRRQFLDQSAIDLAGPVEAKFVTQRSVPNRPYARFVNSHEPEIGGGRRGKHEGPPRAHVRGPPLQALEEIQPQQAQQANEEDNAERNESWDALDGLEFHTRNKAKKPERHKAALVSGKQVSL